MRRSYYKETEVALCAPFANVDIDSIPGIVWPESWNSERCSLKESLSGIHGNLFKNPFDDPINTVGRIAGFVFDPNFELKY